jgi:glycosyltransferase involved in cell wall biosynthesis
VVLFCNAANGPFGYLLKLAGARSAINVDGLEWLRPKWGRLARHYFHFGARCATKSFDVVITDARGMQDVYKKEFGIDSVDIAYGADIRESQHPEKVRELGLAPQEYYLIASRLVPDNNADLIVRAFVASNSRRVLAIAGGTQYRNPFEEYVKSLSDDRVKFLGHINDSELVAELHCNAFAYIHGHEFGGTNPALLKGLAYGNCILALDTVFNREVLKDEEFGLLFPKDWTQLTQLIERIEGEPQLASSYRTKSRERILQRYTWDRITDEYEQLFESMTMQHQ